MGDRKPCCSYARISQDKKKEMGVARQHLNNDEFAGMHGCVIVYRYTDNDITAADPDIERPAFLRLVRDLRARRTAEDIRVEGLFVVEEERVVRLPEDYLKLHRALTVDKSGAFAIKDTNTFLDVHSDSEMIRGLLNSAMGEKEVTKTRRRVTRNMRDQALEGMPTGRRRFGWKGADPKLDRPTNKFLEPKEAKILREALDLALKGKSWATIVHHFEDSKVPTVRGTRWTTTPVQYMLTNPAICGYRMMYGELVRDREHGEPIVGKWETIATPAEWHKMLRRCDSWFNLEGDTAYSRYRAKVKTEGKKNYQQLAEATRKFMLTNIARCGYVDDDGNMCLAKMKGNGPGGSNKHARYRCGDTRCNKVSRRADLVDLAIEMTVIKVLEEQFSNMQPEEQLWYGEGTLTSLLAKREEIKSAYNESRIGMTEYLDFKDTNDKQIADSQKDREDFYAEQAAKNLLAGFKKEKWESFDIRQKRTAIGTIYRAVIIHPIPKGRSRSAEFDPNLLDPIPRETH
ncbi:recombinase family protein [Streptomyces sp. H39-C1]|uniref:recombinase family protein n=1 Tax=Streptomyces sp. H39-C1 TaxID=3004355 RepID=UPI0022B00B57|nr:recombinase family protein [Streptomyces sp. H39-C1]MCZ4095690.1 recombinase family protein [Streptomyces sp. H39-C1]